MKIVEINDTKRVSNPPHRTITLLSSGNFKQNDYVIKSVKLNLYLEKTDENLGPYSLITSETETDKGTIEMIYDEGFRGENSVEKAADFLKSNLGMSGLILRSVIALEQSQKQNTHNI